jgi:putative ABC transport system permease protein
VDPVAEAAGSDIPRTVASGRWLQADENEVVLGAGLAHALNVQIGDTLTLLATTPAGALNALDVSVVGIANIPVRALDDRYLATTTHAATELLDSPDVVSRVSVLLDHGGDEQRVAARLLETLKDRYPEIEARRWDQLAEFYAQVRVLYLGIFGFMGTVLVVVVFLAAFNATLMSVVERTREIGTLRAIGMRQRDIRHQFVREGALAGFFGSIAGALLTLLLMLGLNASGIMLPAPPGATRAIPLHIDFFPLWWLFAGAAMTLTLALAAWFPARRAARLPIVEALGHV